MFTLQQMGTFIRERRLALELTQVDVEERSGGRVSQATIAKFEANLLNQEPGLRIMAGIADALEVDMNQLIGWNVSQTASKILDLKRDSLTIARLADKLSPEHRETVLTFVQRLSRLEEDQAGYNLQLLSEIVTSLEKKQNYELLRKVLNIVIPEKVTGEVGTLPVDATLPGVALERVH